MPKHYSARYVYFTGLKFSATCQCLKSVQRVENGIHFENCWPSTKCIGKTLVDTGNAKGCAIFSVFREPDHFLAAGQPQYICFITVCEYLIILSILKASVCIMLQQEGVELFLGLVFS